AKRAQSSVDVDELPGEATRTDWVLRARWRPVDALALHAYTGGSRLEGLDRPGRADVDRSRRQHGLIADFSRGPLRAHGALRLFGGPDLPSRALDLSGTLDLPTVGGGQASLSS